MKKITLSLVVFLSLLIIVPQVSALSIRISEDGTIEVFDDGVLGEDSEKDDDNEQKVEDDENEQEIEDDDQDDDDQPRSLRTVRPAENKKIEIEPNTQNVRVRLKDQQKVTKPEKTATPFAETEMMETKRVKVQMPAEMDDEKIQEFQQQAKEIRDQRREEIGELKGEIEQKREEYQQQLLEQRKERQQEMIEIKNEMRQNAQNMEIESREIKAQVKQGAQFTIDPDTNQVVVTTPSGNEHVLYHLPDQAIEKMLEAGVIDSKQAAEALEVTEDEQGGLQYSTKSEKTKKLFGLVPWKKATQVKLNDETGDIQEQELPPASLFEQMLGMFSTR